MDITTVIGYSASFVLILSFMMKDLTKLRVWNSLGCVLFVIYGSLLDWNWPIIIPNVFIVGVNIYHLIKERRTSVTEG